MGFYSFYKIIKDIIRTLFGNKILKLILIIFVFSIIFFILGEKGVFATDVTFTHNGQEVTITDINNPQDALAIFYRANYSTPTGIKSTYFYTSWDPSTQKFAIIPNAPQNMGVDTGRFYYTQYGDKTNFNKSAQSAGLGGEFTLLYSNYDIYNLDDFNEVVFTGTPSEPPYISPSLSNTQTQLENLNFSNFTINANSYTDEIENNDGTLFMLFYNRSLSNSSNTDGLYPIKEKGFTKGSIYTDYENSTSDNMVFNFPIFMSGVFFNVGSTYEIKFAKKTFNSEYNTDFYEFFDTSYTFTISSNVTQDYINQINQQTATSSDSENIQELQSSINQQTQSIDNINNTITDSNVDSSSIDLPTDNTNDPTQSGVDNIFQIIYNSFTSGTAQDIVFPIPNTNKNITLSATYLADSLRNNDASWVIDIIQAFYWYIISRYIIVDIMQKVRKIKQGNLENIENSNIKEDML